MSNEAMKKPIVLFVDDEVETLKSVKFGLEERSYSVLTAESGKDALEILKTNVPNIMIIDLRMQPMNGFELYQIIRKNAKFQKVPVFFLTAVDDMLSQKYSQKLGVDAYITKPVDLDNLDALISSKLSSV